MFSENLMRLRKQKGLSQEELSFEIGVTRQTISKWELGETTPDLEKAEQLAKFFCVSLDELTQGKKSSKRKFEYEFISDKKIGELPLVHIHIGMGKYKAKGIIAIGNIASGILSLGFLSFGVLSFGVLSLGLLVFGCLSLGILSLGAITFGAFAIGGIAIGILSIGGIAVGWFSVGGVAVGNYAIGGYASAKEIAYGGLAKAFVSFSTQNGVVVFTKEEIKQAILNVYPHIQSFVLNIFVSLGVS